MAENAVSKSLGSRTPSACTVTWRVCAAFSTLWYRNVMPRSSAFQSTATRAALGIASFRSSRRFALSSADWSVIPVTLPPGRARLSMRPMLSASPTWDMTMGIEVEACRAAAVAGPPIVTITSTPAVTSSAASPGRRSCAAREEADAPSLGARLRITVRRAGKDGERKQDDQYYARHHLRFFVLARFGALPFFALPF